MSEEYKFTIEPATRSKIIPLIGFFGDSGGGKTVSSLMLMRGLVGPTAKIIVVDTDNRRSQICSDLIPGGFSTIDLQPPFHPARCQAAIKAAVDAGAAGVIMDNASAEWEGEMGYLEMKYSEALRMADGKEAGVNAFNFAASGKLKPIHNRFVQFCCRLPVPLILCFAAKEKVRPGKDANGYKVIQKDDFASPIQEGGFIYKMLISGEVFSRENKDTGEWEGGFLSLRGVGKKHTHPDILKIMPKVDGEQISVAHGQALAAWCNGEKPKVAAKPASSPAKASQGASGIVALKRELMALTQPHHEGHAGRLRQWLVDEMLIPDDLPLEELTEAQLIATIAKVKTKLNL